MRGIHRAGRTFGIALLLVWGAAGLAHGAAPGSGTGAALKVENGSAQIDSWKAEDFGWVSRSLAKVPELKSANPRFTFWALGHGKKSVLAMLWDESGGTGTGYDTLYLDKNFNGDLTEEGEKYAGSAEKHTYEIKDLKEADGEGTFSMKLVMEKGNYHWQSGFHASWPNPSDAGKRVGFGVGLLPGNLQIRSAPKAADAPVYRLGGTPTPMLAKQVRENNKDRRVDVYPGETFAEWTAGSEAGVSMAVAVIGSAPENNLRFYHSQAPGGLPVVSLRVHGPDGKAAEEIAFTGGCGCAGSFGQELLIPRRVAPGTHTLVIRLNRPDWCGGKAEYLYPVSIQNPDFGKAYEDPAYVALKSKFGGTNAKIASLRRAVTPEQLAKTYPEEPIQGGRVWDNYMMSNSMHWDSKIANNGSAPYIEVGQKAGINAPNRGLIRFDLSGLPKGAKLLGAYARFTLVNVPWAGAKEDASVEAYAVRRAWNEVPENNLYCSWYGPLYRGNKRQPEAPDVVFWKQGGCEDPQEDRYPDAAGSFSVANFPAKPSAKGAADGERFRMVAMDITATAQKWLSGELENHGLVLVFKGSGGWAPICSSEHPEYIFRPTLVLAYEGGAMMSALTKPRGEDLDLARAEAQKRGVPVAIKFYSPTCSVCVKANKTTFADKTVQETLSKQVEFVSLKVEDYPKLAQDLGVGSVPTLVVLNADGATAKAALDSEVLLDGKALVAKVGEATK